MTCNDFILTKISFQNYNQISCFKEFDPYNEAIEFDVLKIAVTLVNNS